MSKTNVFATHPVGYRIHFEITHETTPEELNGMLVNLAKLTGWMADKEYAPEYQATPSTTATQREPEGTGGPACPDCNGPMELKSGKAKNGKPWQGWFCLRTKDAPKAQRHTPLWIDD